MDEDDNAAANSAPPPGSYFEAAVPQPLLAQSTTTYSTSASSSSSRSHDAAKINAQRNGMTPYGSSPPSTSALPVVMPLNSGPGPGPSISAAVPTQQQQHRSSVATLESVGSHTSPAGSTSSPFATPYGPIYNRSSSFTMMDLDESLRALYFAPMPLIVTDLHRNIRLCNRPAELLLAQSASNCLGQRLDKFISSSSRSQLTLACNEAFQRTDRVKWQTPIDTRVTLLTGEEQIPQHADLSISAWCSGDAIFTDSSPDVTNTSSSPAASKSGAGSGSESSRRTSVGPLFQDTHFTIGLLPSRSNERGLSPIEEHLDKVDKLKEGILYTLETAVMALSSDGKAVYRNRACESVLAKFERQEPKAFRPPDEDEMRAKATDIDLTWLSMTINCYDEYFEQKWGEDAWPIYRAAVKGERTPVAYMGCEVPETGERVILELEGKPIRDAGGFGEHIGGLITLRDVTEERTTRRNEIQQQGHEYFKQTCDALPQLIWTVTPAGYTEWFSKAWYEYTGAVEHESLGAGWLDSFHPDDLADCTRRWTHSLRTGEMFEVAYRCLRKDGMYRWMLGRALPLRDHRTGAIIKWFGTCTDIHDQVEALSASRQAQAQLGSVINQAAMTLWAIDREGIVTVAEGPGVRQLKLMNPGTPAGSEKEANVPSPCGYVARDEKMASEDGDAASVSASHSNSGSGSRTRQSMIGRSIYHVWDSVDTRIAIQKALEGQSITEEMEIDGRWFRTSYNPLRAAQPEGPHTRVPEAAAAGERAEEAEIIGVVGASMDITERKRAQLRMEESLVEKSRALAAEGAAREASRLKSEFLANMSHEIRTPIAGVIGLSELLLDEKLTPQQRDYAETIQRSAEGLLTVINDVLDFSKVEIGKLDVEKAPFSLEVVLRDQKRMLSFATQKKGLEFRDSVDLRYKGLLIGDAGRLRQVITNILTNAIKFTAIGYISMTVAEVSEDANSVTVKFDIRDTGCGIAPETLSRLFQPFSQADPSTARRFGGTGLGLSISKNLVELMHGEIGLNSVEGQGSHAWFMVPFAKAQASEVRAMDQIIAQPSPGGTSGMPGLERNPLSLPRKDVWILIVEDNLVNAQIASKNIKKMGFSCRIAENGLLALEALNQGSPNFSLALMDCHMPECDGYEATRLIRKSTNPDIRMLPVIALTASAIKGDRERALEAGMVDYLAKPVKRAPLEATLCRWLYDHDARSVLSRFSAPPPTQEPAASLPPMQPTGSTAATVSPGLSPKSLPVGEEPRIEYPFPTPAEQASAAARRRSNSPAFNQASRTLKVNTSHALGAAAALLASRRLSDDTPLANKFVTQRPKMSPRSKSHQHTPTGGSSSSTSTLGPTRTQRGGAPVPPYFARRSSREQSGIGRDLENEVWRAAGFLSPGLDAAMEGEADESQDLEAAARAEKEAEELSAKANAAAETAESHAVAAVAAAAAVANAAVVAAAAGTVVGGDAGSPVENAAAMHIVDVVDADGDSPMKS